MNPLLHEGEYVFCPLEGNINIDISHVLGSFKEEEGITIVVEKRVADEMKLTYSFVSSWITLQVHSSLEAVGLTAAFSKALSDAGISCNVIAAFYHDHIFVDRKDSGKAMEILTALSESNI